MRNIYFEKYTLETTCNINVAYEEALGGVTRIYARAATHARKKYFFFATSGSFR